MIVHDIDLVHDIAATVNWDPRVFVSGIQENRPLKNTLCRAALVTNDPAAIIAAAGNVKILDGYHERALGPDDVAELRRLIGQARWKVRAIDHEIENLQEQRDRLSRLLEASR
jgi:hypothetical protein